MSTGPQTDIPAQRCGQISEYSSYRNASTKSNVVIQTALFLHQQPNDKLAAYKKKLRSFNEKVCPSRRTLRHMIQKVEFCLLCSTFRRQTFRSESR